MNVYKHVMLGLEAAIEREVGDLFHNICAGGGVIGGQARDRLQTIKHSAAKLRQLIEEDERNANEISRTEAGDVRGSFRQGQYRYSPQGSEGVRRSGQAWEASEVRPQIEKREAVDQSKIDYKGPE